VLIAIRDGERAVASSTDSTEFRTGQIVEEERMKISENRKRLLLDLEDIIGNECYNANIQNWGPRGVFEGEGREFRYPVTFIDDQGNKIKRKKPDADIPTDVAVTGYYAFGANQLQIIRALNKVVTYLEKHHGLKT
jgi:hypothetical protein